MKATAGLILILTTIGFTGFTGPDMINPMGPTAFYFTGVPTSEADVEMWSKWESKISPVCLTLQGEGFAYKIVVDPNYSHSEGTPAREILNIPGNTPSGESILCIDGIAGYLDGMIQYYKVNRSNTVGYTVYNGTVR